MIGGMRSIDLTTRMRAGIGVVDGKNPGLLRAPGFFSCHQRLLPLLCGSGGKVRWSGFRWSWAPEMRAFRSALPNQKKADPLQQVRRHVHSFCQKEVRGALVLVNLHRSRNQDGWSLR